MTEVSSDCGCGECRSSRVAVNDPRSPFRPAPGTRGLKGSRFVGSRGIRDLLVCRTCGALWWTWIDAREGWRGVRCLGAAAVPIFAADTSLGRIVGWIASEFREARFAPVHRLATMVVRRRPEGLQSGVDAMLDAIVRLSRPESEDAASRLAMLFRVLKLVVERAIRGDLRGPAPRVKPPRRWTEDELEVGAGRWLPAEVDGLAQLARTHEVVRRLLWEGRRGSGASRREDAVVVIDDAAPILEVLATLPFDRVPDATLRGVFASALFEGAKAVVSLGLAPENDHAIWMREPDWRKLARAVDPVVRLAGSAKRLLSASGDAGEVASAVAMEAVLVRAPIRSGARFTDDARGRLRSMSGRLGEGGRIALEEILDLEASALRADAACALATGHDA